MSDQREAYDFPGIGKLDKINQPIYFKGFTSFQLAILFLVFAVIGLVSMVAIGVYTFVAVPVLLIPILLIGKRIKQENDAGNPNYLGSIIYFWQIKKRFTDRHNLLRFLDRDN